MGKGGEKYKYTLTMTFCQNNARDGFLCELDSTLITNQLYNGFKADDMRSLRKSDKEKCTERIAMGEKKILETKDATFEIKIWLMPSGTKTPVLMAIS
jgi:hypothetical protein